MDRFIPNRSLMDMNYANAVLTWGSSFVVPSTRYQHVLAAALGQNRSRILEFGEASRVRIPKNPNPDDFYDSLPPSMRKRREFPVKPRLHLDAPDLNDNEGCNVIDWGKGNKLAIVLGAFDLHIMDFNSSGRDISSRSFDDLNPISSLKWGPAGNAIAVGLVSGKVQVWDVNRWTKVKEFRSASPTLVGSLEWKDGLITAGGWDGSIINYDVASGRTVGSYGKQEDQIWGLKRSHGGQRLASCGKDGVVSIWDRAMPSRRVFELRHHEGPVRAIGWCPFRYDVLASGGQDGSVKFCTIHTGECLKSVDCGSNVNAILWNEHHSELLTAHGLPHNQIALWKYSAMEKMAEFKHHRSRVMYMASSPDGRTMASAAGKDDESLAFWDIFEAPPREAHSEPFSGFPRIRTVTAEWAADIWLPMI